jgi:hypothetical protein
LVRVRELLPLFLILFNRIIMEHPVKISSIAPAQTRATLQSLHQKLDRLKYRAAIRAAMPQAFADDDKEKETAASIALTHVLTRGGVYGVTSTITLTRSLTQAATMGYTVLRDGFQPTDLKQAATLVPELFVVVANYPTMRLELGELDTEDSIELAGEFVNLTRIVTTALANSEPDETEFIRVYSTRARDGQAITPQAAYEAARLSLYSLSDVIQIGFHSLHDGFSVLDIPALVGMFPDATKLATNAPLALQGWKQLTKQQKKDLGKLAVEIVADIWDTLETVGKKVGGKPALPLNAIAHHIDDWQAEVPGK